MYHYKDYIDNDLFRPKLIRLKKKTLCDNIFCFDIETCNYFIDKQNNVLSINDIFDRARALTSKPKEQAEDAQNIFDECEAGATCFIWQ